MRHLLSENSETVEEVNDMQLFLDSAKTVEIERALEMWDVDGVTTNPRHIQESGKSFRRAITEIADLFAGTDKPISVEVDPHLTDWNKIVEQGLELSRLSPNFVIKVGISESGAKAIRELTARGVRVNATLVFSVAQAWQAARAGAAYISPFLGWKEQFGDDANTLIADVRSMLDNFDYAAQIIAAAVRNSRQIGDAAAAGAHCLTAGMSTCLESFQNPYTNMGEQLFQDAWDQTPQ
jgi:transaldolase